MNEIYIAEDMSYLSEQVRIYEKSYSDMKTYIKSIFDNYLKIGKILNDLKQSEAFLCAEYSNIYEYAKNEFNLSATTVKNLISIFNKFCVIDKYNSPVLNDEFKEFNYSQLVELVSVDNLEIDNFKSNMSVKVIRENKNKIKLFNKFTSASTSELDLIRNYINDKFVDFKNKFNIEINYDEKIKTYLLKFILNLDNKLNYKFDIAYKISSYNFEFGKIFYSYSYLLNIPGLSYSNYFDDYSNCFKFIDLYYNAVINKINENLIVDEVHDNEEKKGISEGNITSSEEKINDNIPTEVVLYDNIYDFNSFISELMVFEDENYVFFNSNLFLDISSKLNLRNCKFEIIDLNDNYFKIYFNDNIKLEFAFIIYEMYLKLNYYKDNTLVNSYSLHDVLNRGLLDILKSDVGLQ